MELIDTHCHLDLAPLSEDVNGAISRAKLAGIVQAITVGVSVESSRMNVQLANQHPMLFASVGIHPHEADTVRDEHIQEMTSLAADPRVVAIGEVGLDNYRVHSSQDNQKRIFKAFVDMAHQTNLPLIIHCREAYDELLDILSENKAYSTYRGVLHCVSGPVEYLKEALALGFYASFAGNVTFPSAKDLQALIEHVPDDRLLVETDSPYLAPQVVRGKTNEPAYVAHTAEFIAQRRGQTTEKIAQLTTDNARRLFRLPIAK